MRDDLAARLETLAARIDRLRPLNHNPEAYFLERDDIRQALIAEAATLRRRGAPANARGKFESGDFLARGRVVRAERRNARRAGIPKETAWPNSSPKSSPRSATASSPTGSAISTPAATGSAKS